MMSQQHEDPNDTNRHRNLLRIGQVYSLPPRADRDRQARWQQATSNKNVYTTHKGVTFMKRHKNLAFLTSGAVAAVLALAVWFGLGATATVSADVILENFKAALGRKLTINIEDIDLGNVAVNGEIVLDRKGNWLNEATDTLYSELHVTLKADNPDWNDLDGAIVVCQSPDHAWTYCRGNGGSTNGLFAPRRVIESDYLIKGRQWREFMENPLGGFGAMPLSLSFSSGASQVTYRFPVAQRTYVQQLLYFLLLNLGNAESADHVIEALKASAGDVVVERNDDMSWVLRASDIKQIGALKLPEPVEVPDIEALMKEHVTTVTYDQRRRGISKIHYGALPEPLSRLGVSIASHNFQGSKPGSVEALMDQLEPSSEVVASDQISESEWEIQVKGFPVELDTSGIDWTNKILPGLMGDLDLLVYYDAKTKSVQRAEFLGIGSKEGKITLELGEAHLDPARLEWDDWIKDCTDSDEEANNSVPWVLRNCTEIFDRRGSR
ncbi:MAG: hypothetical protein MI923_29865 [Phycisphaerales bacterium]|nr:hypothetical protein [Phycisphaerales bacterium]